MNFDLLKGNFSVQYINALLQSWNNTRQFRCIGKPKKQNLLLYLQGISITYTDRMGNRIAARSGDVVYTPEGSEYRAEISDLQEEGHTVGINFLLFDAQGSRAVLSDKICVFHNAGTRLSMLFHRAPSFGIAASSLRNRILVMEILCALTELSGTADEKRGPGGVAAYIAEHIEENPSVAFLAARYGMSQVTFRKHFRAEFGVSPVEYRNGLRLSRAAMYLEYGEISVQEISDTLGYATVSHFIKEFKKAYSVTPKQYRKSSRDLHKEKKP